MNVEMKDQRMSNRLFYLRAKNIYERPIKQIKKYFLKSANTLRITVLNLQRGLDYIMFN